MRKVLIASVAALAVPSLSYAQTAGAVGSMLEQVDTSEIVADVGTFMAGGILVLLTLMAIPLAKKLIASVMK